MVCWHDMDDLDGDFGWLGWRKDCLDIEGMEALFSGLVWTLDRSIILFLAQHEDTKEHASTSYDFWYSAIPS